MLKTTLAFAIAAGNSAHLKPQTVWLTS